MRQRMIRGLSATALGPLITAAIQLVSVPVFLHFWGAKLYGEWLILSALPTYLGLSDFGFGGVAGNEMTMQVARGDRQGALTTFQSTWVLTTAVSLLIAAAAGAGLWFLPLRSWLNLAQMGGNEARIVVALLAAYTLLGLQGTLLAAGFRCDGNYALGTLLGNGIRVGEFSALSGAVVWGGGPAAAALSLLLVRALGTLLLGRVLFRKNNWLGYGRRHARRATLRKLLRPAAAFVAFPIGGGLSMQGMLVAIGALLGPLAVVTFSTLRTLTRFSAQGISVVHLAVWPELSAACGAGDRQLARLLHRCTCQASLWISVAAAAALCLAGNGILAAWTRGRVAMDWGVFLALLLVLISNSFWAASSVLLLASNQHQRAAPLYLAGTVSSLLLACLLMPRLGLAGAALALLSLDLTFGWFVVRSSLLLLEERLGEFCAALLRLPAAHLRPPVGSPS